MYHDGPTVWDLERKRASPAVETEFSAVAVVSGDGPVLGAGQDLFTRAVTCVEVAGLPQAVDGCLMIGGLVRLPHRRRVRGDAEPIESRDDAVGPRLAIALLIGVLDAKEVGPVEVTSEKPIEKRCPRASNVQVPSRRGSEADPWAGWGL